MEEEIKEEIPQSPEILSVKKKKPWLMITFVLSIVIIFGAIGFFTYQNYPKIDISKIENNISQSSTQSELLKGTHSISSQKVESIPYVKDFLIEVSKNQTLETPSFAKGKIAFIKDNNLWVAESNSIAYNITKDATSSIMETYPASIYYSQPKWSPEGNKIAFIQSVAGIKKILITDLQELCGDTMMSTIKHPAYWINENKILIADKAITTTTLEGIKWSGVNLDNDPYFYEYSVPTECGGGGNSESRNLLTKNNFGYNRNIFIYLSATKEIVYSTGCENEITQIIKAGDKKISLFGAENKENPPMELVISNKKDKFAGVLNGNIVLLNLNGQLIQELTSSGKNYGPIFSPDDLRVYFVEKTNEIPEIKYFNLEDKKITSVFKSDINGEISNISPSPYNQSLIFTLIKQTKDPDISKKDYAGEAEEELYMINSDGSDLKLFVKNASQGTWGK